MAKVTVTDRVIIAEEREKTYSLELTENEARALTALTGKIAYQPNHRHSLYDVYHELGQKVGYYADLPRVVVGEPYPGSVKFADPVEEIEGVEEDDRDYW
jgi:hypothetical protein